MGFNEIYLLGQDCNFASEMQHSQIADPEYSGRIDLSSGQILIDCFQNHKDFYKDTNIKIINCTRGGKLEVFERKNLEDVLAKER